MISNDCSRWRGRAPRASACGGDGDSADRRHDEPSGTRPARRASRRPTWRSTSSASGEGELNILAWPGYAEDGTTDPTVDWVTPFEEETGLHGERQGRRHLRRAWSADETGEYDVVSASGDASLRLIYAGDVAPVNTDLVPNYADVSGLPEETAVELGRRRDVRHPARLGRQPAVYRTPTR